MSEATNVCRQADPVTGEPIDSITATNLRRHFGNTLVVPPVKHRGGGVFEEAVLAVGGTYFYPSERYGGAFAAKYSHKARPELVIEDWPVTEPERQEAALAELRKLVHDGFPVDPNAPKR